MAQLRLFVSAVTNEFGKVRDALAADLRARGHFVRVQSDFTQSADSETLLGRLAEYIRDCHAVICIIGKQCGDDPPPRAVERLPGILPKDIKEASYTQWEFFLARHYKRRPYVYSARDDYVPDKPLKAGDRTALQTAYVDFLKKEDGVQYGLFSNIDQLARAVLKDLPELAPELTPRPARGMHIVLPYPSIADLFKGRDDFMRRLHESLKRSRGARTAIVSSALYGLGGIGKTRVAVEYAWAHADHYNALLFAVAETPEALRRNLAALAAALVPQLDTTDDTVRLAAVLDWLKTNPSWFLILDNVDSKDALAEVERLLRDLAGGHVVVTSRLADFSGHFQPLELDVLAIDDAAAFLLERTKDRRRAQADDEAKAREIAEELGGLALALEQAAAFVAKRRLTFAQYLEQWRAQREDILKWWDATVTDYPRSVAVTWQTSVARLSENGRRLLERLAWLAPEKVPEFLFDVPIPGVEGEDLHAACDDLAAYSLVTRDAEGPFVLVHRLVQDVTRRSLTNNARARSLIEALRWINERFIGNPNDVRTWPILDPLAPHVRALTTYAVEASIPIPTTFLLDKLGVLLSAKASYAEAEPLFRRALAIDEEQFGENHPDFTMHLNNLAELLRATNRLIEAKHLVERALMLDEKNVGPNDSKVAVELNNLALLLLASGQFAEAEPLLRRALNIGEANFGPIHEDVAARLSNLAMALDGMNRDEEAEQLIRRGLAIDKEIFGPDHPQVAIRLNNLALLLQKRGRFSEAEQFQHRALTIAETHFGPDHPTVAIYLNNVARLLQATNRLGEAEPLMRRHVAIFVEVTRRTRHRHPHLDAAFRNYAGLLAAMGKSEAEIEAACAELMQPLASDPSS